MNNVYSLTYQKIKRVFNFSTASALDRVEVVSQDRFLKAKLLRLVNSRCQRFPAKIESVAGAIAILGFDVVEAIINDQYNQYR